MSVRSTTGCYSCKTRRKKCDETKPTCLRCTKSRRECQYVFVQPDGRGTKKRTKPAPRLANELAMKLEKQQSKSVMVPEAANVSESSNPIVGLSDCPLVPSANVSLPLDTDWDAGLYSPATFPSLDPSAVRAVPFPYVAIQQPIAPRNLTSNQASLFNALFSLEETNPPQTSYPPLEQALTHSPPRIEPILFTSHPFASNPYSAPSSTLDSNLDEYRQDDDDLEGVTEIFTQTPLALDRMVDSNLLPFVLQSFAQWIPLAVFDPLRMIHGAKQAIISRFSQSPASRTRLLLMSELTRSLVKSWTLDEGERRKLRLLRNEVWRTVTGYQLQRWPPSVEDRERANAALDDILELMSIQVISLPISDSIHLLRSAAPVFLAACGLPHPPHLFNILLESGMNLKHLAALDVVTSVTSGRPLMCRYHIPWSLELCDEFLKKREDQGLQWLLGIPDQFIMLFAYLQGVKEDAETTGTAVDPRIIAQVEEDIRRIVILPCEGKDPSLTIGRMVVQECWREAVFIYLYMALGGASADDCRVKRAQRGFMRLVNGMKLGRNPHAFLLIPTNLVGIATTKSSHRDIIRSRIFSLPECAFPNTAGNDAMLILEDVWRRTELEGRIARWEDLREASRRITAI